MRGTIAMIYAKDCKCVECGEPAVAFWPCIDPDIPSHPYCRKCLDKDGRLKGYGTALLDALEDRAKGKVKRVIIDYCPKSTPMWVLAWYMRRGYKITYNSKEKKILTKTL